MTSLHSRILDELHLIERALTIIEAAERKLQVLAQEFGSTAHPTIPHARVSSPLLPPQPVLDEYMLKRADDALRRLGFVSKPTASENYGGRKADVAEHETATGVDMRCIERTNSGSYRCTLRRGKKKRRLDRRVYKTLKAAQAARDALEAKLFGFADPKATG